MVRRMIFVSIWPHHTRGRFLLPWVPASPGRRRRAFRPRPGPHLGNPLQTSRPWPQSFARCRTGSRPSFTIDSRQLLVRTFALRIIAHRFLLPGRILVRWSTSRRRTTFSRIRFPAFPLHRVIQVSYSDVSGSFSMRRTHPSTSMFPGQPWCVHVGSSSPSRISLPSESLLPSTLPLRVVRSILYPSTSFPSPLSPPSLQECGCCAMHGCPMWCGAASSSGGFAKPRFGCGSILPFEPEEHPDRNRNPPGSDPGLLGKGPEPSTGIQGSTEGETEGGCYRGGRNGGGRRGSSKSDQVEKRMHVPTCASEPVGSATGAEKEGRGTFRSWPTHQT